VLGGKVYVEQQIAGALQNDQGLFGAENLTLLKSPGTEMESWIISQTDLGEQVTVKKIVDRFDSKPYGWDLGSIEVVLGWLVGNGKVALTVDTNPVVRTEAAALIRNTGKHQHTVVEPQKAYNATKVAAFKKFCTDFFNEGAVPSDPTELARFGRDKLAAKREELNALVSTSRYPFVSQLAGVVTLLDQIIGKPADWYLEDFDKAEELIEAKTDLIDPIKSFLNGQQANIFDEAQALLSANNGNLSYLPPGSADSVENLLADPNAFRGNKMNQLKVASDSLASLLESKLAESLGTVKAEVETKMASLRLESVFSSATEDLRIEVETTVGDFLSATAREHLIALVEQGKTRFEQIVYPALVERLLGSGADGNEPTKLTVGVATIKATGGPMLIETESDVEAYLVALRTALVQAINDGKRITG
jgi:hypothetical protein